MAENQFQGGPSRNVPGRVIKTGQGVDIHIVPNGKLWEVWLNTEGEIFDGLVIGLGDTEQDARIDAGVTLAYAVNLMGREDAHG